MESRMDKNTANMKTNSLLLIVTAAGLALAGCKKSDSSSNVTSPMGALASIRKAFPNPGPDVTPSIEKITSSVRYGEYPTALAELEKLAANPNLTPDQKKALADATDQVKKSMATAAPK